MPKNLKRYEQARAASTIGRQPAPKDGLVNINAGSQSRDAAFWAALSRTVPGAGCAGRLGACAREHLPLALWQAPGTLCWEIRQEIFRQPECSRYSSSLVEGISAEDCQRLAFQVSTNLKYRLSGRTVIEATRHWRHCGRIQTWISVFR